MTLKRRPQLNLQPYTRDLHLRTGKEVVVAAGIQQFKPAQQQ